MTSAATATDTLKTTCIRSAAWVAAWDRNSESHVYRRDIDIAFRGDRIIFVGPSYAEPVDMTVDGRQLFVMPGLVDVHSHPTTEPSFKGIREEHGVPEMYMTGLYERVVAFQLDEDGRRAAVAVAYSELLSSGATTVVDLSMPLDGWIRPCRTIRPPGVPRAELHIRALAADE